MTLFFDDFAQKLEKNKKIQGNVTHQRHGHCPEHFLMSACHVSAKVYATTFLAVFLAFSLNIKTLTAQSEKPDDIPAQKKSVASEKKIPIQTVKIEKDSNIAILLKNKDFLQVDFTRATQQTIKKQLQNLKEVETFPPSTHKNTIKWSSKKPLPLKLYQKKKTKDEEEKVSKRIKQAYSYLKKKDFTSFHSITSDIILRHHFSAAAAQAAFLAAWSLMDRDLKDPYRYFDKTTQFFGYIINAHRYTKYCDGSMMLLIPWLLKKDFPNAQMLLEKYIDLQGKTEKIRWNEELDIEEELENTFVSRKKSQKITNSFLDAVITITQIEHKKLLQTKENWKKKQSLKKIRSYLHYLQQFFKKQQP